MLLERCTHVLPSIDEITICLKFLSVLKTLFRNDGQENLILSIAIPGAKLITTFRILELRIIRKLNLVFNIVELVIKV